MRTCERKNSADTKVSGGGGGGASDGGTESPWRQTHPRVGGCLKDSHEFHEKLVLEQAPALIIAIGLNSAENG